MPHFHAKYPSRSSTSVEPDVEFVEVRSLSAVNVVVALYGTRPAESLLNRPPVLSASMVIVSEISPQKCPHLLPTT